MKDYVLVTTLCDNEEIAKKIIDALLEKRLIAGAQVSKIYSKYWWNNELEECDEYKIEMRTKAYLFNEINYVIHKIHDYEVSEVSCVELVNADDKFLRWIDENVG